jgi:hypothetical protein
MDIREYLWLLMVIIWMVIGSILLLVIVDICGYLWILIVIILMVIGGYFINDY